MYIALIQLQVKPDQVEAFKEFVRLDHEGTRTEPGNVRFDVLQAEDDPTRFCLYEVYRDKTAVEAHRQTPHYAHWMTHIEEYLVAPRTATRYWSLFPTDEAAW
ncbi:MAG: antibiotic biosynthesis monooxygenase [Anaerolineae bacterium]|nr:antibiotic biosynthesis monooxygenase [Anaerolineae bacterium]